MGLTWRFVPSLFNAVILGPRSAEIQKKVRLFN